MTHSNITCRRMNAGVGILATVALIAQALAAPETPAVPSYQPKAVQVKPVGSSPYAVGEVRLLDGPFKVSMETDAKNLLSLDLDRLLAPFITESRGTPTALPYLGWETRVLPGVALSFYLSGASRLYLLTGNKEFRDRIDRLLTGLEACQKRNGGGYLLGTVGGRHIFARLEKEGYFPDFSYWGGGQATPYYALEKLMSGLRDVYRVCGDERALRISVGIGNWLERHMARISDADLQKIMGIEYGGMNWVLADLYADTGDARYLALSRRWQDNITVVPMTKGEDVLAGVHANMQFPKFSGLAARYPYSGDPGDFAGARFFWESVVHHRTYVTGGNSESEFFGPRDDLRHRLSPYTEENCNEYNMLRLTGLLARIEPRVEYADYCERILFNHLLAAQNPADGKLCYFIPLIPGAAKYYQPLEFFSCCTASGLDSYARPAEYIYSREGDAVYVHQYIASEVRDGDRDFVIRQDTEFPNRDVSTFTFRCDRAIDLELCIRNPHWAGNQVTLTLNGQVQPVTAAGDGYYHLRRTWADGDAVEVKFELRVRTESMPDDKGMVALFYGPILLSAHLETADADALVEANEAPALVPGGLPLDQWLRPAGAPLNFTTTVARPKQFELAPFYLKKTGPYAVYWQQMSEPQWNERLRAHEQRKTEALRLDAVTVDKVVAGDSESESRHHLAGTSTTGKGNGSMLGNLAWRTSQSNAFGYDLAVDGSVANALYCRFMGRESYEAWSCRITVDGTPIQTLERKKDDSYPVVPWEATYPIPPELTRGKSKARILFEPLQPDRMKMPRLMELRTVRPD